MSLINHATKSSFKVLHQIKSIAKSTRNQLVTHSFSTNTQLIKLPSLSHCKVHIG